MRVTLELQLEAIPFLRLTTRLNVRTNRRPLGRRMVADDETFVSIVHMQQLSDVVHVVAGGCG